MELYERNLMTNIIEARLLESYEEYCPQGQYNNKVISYLYKYIRDNTYSGEHDELLRQFTSLKLNNALFKNTEFKELVNRKTYTITDDTGITAEMYDILFAIIREYYNYKFTVVSDNRIEVDVNFGWLPPNTASWLNLFNDECLIDYYIDGITLRPNTYSTLGTNRPDSGFVCYKISGIKEYDTIMFLANKKEMQIEDLDIPKFKVASVLNEIEGSKGATLNRIVEFNVDSFFYEIGPYNRNYLTTTDASVVIQIPYEYAVGSYYQVFDVSNSVKINNKNNIDANNQDNYFVLFSDPNFDSKFTRLNINNVKSVANELIEKGTNSFDTTLQQYVLGDFIWKTSDSKLVAYAQNLINSLFTNAQIISNGIWSKQLSELITRYKMNNKSLISAFGDDVIDKITEENMLTEYKQVTGQDPNVYLFNEW